MTFKKGGVCKLSAVCKLFVFRHAETTDNSRGIFSGWRDPQLTQRGLLQAKQIADQLKRSIVDFAFTSHLRRAGNTLEIVLENHPGVAVFVDDRLIERCYGLLQGRSKAELARERPEWFAKVHRGYNFPPPGGESLKMVEQRTVPFLEQLTEWLAQNPGNVAISCHGNSLRPIRRVFEHLSLRQMLQIENPQDRAKSYVLHIHNVNVKVLEKRTNKPNWQGPVVPHEVRLASDIRNPLRVYY